jgi:hypothetical protein
MRRNQGSRSLRKSIPAVIGPGITEFYYFKHLKKFAKVHYKTKPSYFGTESINEIEKIIEKVLEEDRLAICVFDKDALANNQAEKRKFERLVQKYNNEEKVLICESMPSTEFWFLLHYVNTNRAFRDSKAVEQELRKHLDHYRKEEHFLEKDSWVGKLCEDGKLKTAIERATEFGKKGASYSTIYKVFGHISK